MLYLKSKTLGVELKETSVEFRQIFLLAFTKALIEHQGPNALQELNITIKEENKKKTLEEKGVFSEIIKEQIKEELHPKNKDLIPEAPKILSPKKLPMPVTPKFKPLPKPPLSKELFQPKTRPLSRMMPNNSPKPLLSKKPSSFLHLYDPKLPEHLHYIKPTPGNTDIDLDKLNPFLQDPKVMTIECPGPGKNILVRGTMGTKPTSLILEAPEIHNILERFSVVAKIPLSEGVSRIVVGKLILSSIVSNLVGSKFIIQKMLFPGMSR